MAENERQSETCILVNDKSQGTVARRVRYCEIFSDRFFSANLLLSRRWKNLKIIGERLAKLHVTGKKANCLTCRVRLSAVLLKDEELARDLKHGTKQLLLTVVTMVLIWQHQTGVDLFWSANWYHQRLTERFYRATQLCKRGLGSRTSVRPSVCLSHACLWLIQRTYRRYFFIPHKGAILLVFLCQRSRRNSNGVTHNGGAKERWGRLKRRFSTNIWLYLTNGAK